MNRISLWISATTVNHVSKRLGLEVRRRVSPAILIKGLFGSGLLSWSGSRIIILVIRFSIENGSLLDRYQMVNSNHPDLPTMGEEEKKCKRSRMMMMMMIDYRHSPPCVAATSDGDLLTVVLFVLM